MDKKTIAVLKTLYLQAQKNGKMVSTIVAKRTLSAVDVLNILQYGVAMGGIFEISINEIGHRDVKTYFKDRKVTDPQIYNKISNMNKEIGIELVREVSAFFVTFSNFIEKEAQKTIARTAQPPTDMKH